MATRPRFDFVGSLELCRKLVELAEDLEKEGSTRKTSRDTAVAEGSFQGPYGVDHRGRAAAEDMAIVSIVEALEDGAEAWAKAWQAAADQMNQYAAELAQEECDAMYATRLSIWARSGSFDPEAGTWDYPPSPARGTVTEPKAAPKPTGKEFAPESAFAKYYASGINMHCTYVDSPTV